MPDGSIVFNFDYGGTAKPSRCGEVVLGVGALTPHDSDDVIEKYVANVHAIYPASYFTVDDWSCPAPTS